MTAIMLFSTLKRVRCPACGGVLTLTTPFGTAPESEITTGTLACSGCAEKYPIVAGVAVLVPNANDYLLAHAKGVAKFARADDLPKKIRRDFKGILAELADDSEHIAEDLESERVIALYLLTHYYDAGSLEWWKAPGGEDSDPLIDSLIRTHWDHGPFRKIEDLLATRLTDRRLESGFQVVELGCGVGGLARRLPAEFGAYLGVDTSFASVAAARAFNLGVARPHSVSVPADLIGGALARALPSPDLLSPHLRANVDFVVGDIDGSPAAPENYAVSIALNAIDMLDDPAALPRSQSRSLKKGGLAIQSGPYVWHPVVAEALRLRFGADAADSAEVVVALYEKAGLRVEKSLRHVPWLFFKHLRQLEVYSTHLLFATKQ